MQPYRQPIFASSHHLCRFIAKKQERVKNFRLLTITHKTANINHIGQYIPTVNSDPKALATRLHQIKEHFQMEELLYMATCNRLTFFFIREEPSTENFVLDLFSRLHPGIPIHCLGGVQDVIARYNGVDCVRHLFEVAASLDSLVVGEREILRQIREAYEFCQQEKLSGDQIRLIMKMAIPTAKEVYTRTKIGENNVSVVSLAVLQMLQHEPPKDAKFLVIGAGQTNALVIKLLGNKGYSNFTIFNRSLKKATYLASQVNGKAYTLDQLSEYQQPFDVLICCTRADRPTITDEVYQQIIGKDTQTKIIVDLGVPGDVHPKVVQNNEVHYVEIESLRRLAEENLARRMNEVEAASEIVGERIEEFRQNVRQRRVERALATIPSKVKGVSDRALNGVFKKEIQSLDPTSKELLERVVSYMEKKYISIPMMVAREVVEEELNREKEEKK